MKSSDGVGRIFCSAVAILVLVGAGLAQGITTKKGAVVLYGSTANCSQPATIHWKKVCDATPECKKIKAQGVRKGSARYDLLISEMNDRIKRAAAAVADAEGRDCVLRKRDIKKSKGLQVADITKLVIAELGA